MVKIDKEYVFDGPNGKETLADLFDGRSQLIVYHFMLGPGWGEGCKSCSYLADHFDGANLHLPHRDVTFVVRFARAAIPRFKRIKNGWAGVSMAVITRQRLQLRLPSLVDEGGREDGTKFITTTARRRI